MKSLLFTSHTHTFFKKWKGSLKRRDNRVLSYRTFFSFPHSNQGHTISVETWKEVCSTEGDRENQELHNAISLETPCSFVDLCILHTVPWVHKVVARWLLEIEQNPRQTHFFMTRNSTTERTVLHTPKKMTGLTVSGTWMYVQVDPSRWFTNTSVILNPGFPVTWFCSVSPPSCRSVCFMTFFEMIGEMDDGKTWLH